MPGRRVFAAAMPLLLALFGAGACSFPDVSFLDGVGGLAGSSSSSSTGSSVGGGGAGGQGGGEGGTASSSSSVGGGGGQGGQGGGQGGQGGAGGQGGQGGQGGADCTDADKDKDSANAVECGGTDCDDNNDDVFVGQTNFFETPRANGSYDYNCSGVNEREFETVKCMGLCAAKTNVFIGDPMNPAPCGAMASFGNCSGLCQTSNLTVKPMRCH